MKKLSLIHCSQPYSLIAPSRASLDIFSNHPPWYFTATDILRISLCAICKSVLYIEKECFLHPKTIFPLGDNIAQLEMHIKNASEITIKLMFISIWHPLLINFSFLKIVFTYLHHFIRWRVCVHMACFHLKYLLPYIKHQHSLEKREV